MAKQSDMWHIYSRSDQDDDWTWRLQSTDNHYLEGQGNEWERLGFITDFKVVQNNT